jgi:hypothetical protein
VAAFTDKIGDARLNLAQKHAELDVTPSGRCSRPRVVGIRFRLAGSRFRLVTMNGSTSPSSTIEAANISALGVAIGSSSACR